MSILKFGEAHTIQASDILDSHVVLSDPQIVERFQKFAHNLKKVAPKADDFIYFSAVMMHASEASLLNNDGSFKKDASGKDLECKWVEQGKNIRWWCSDSNVLPYKNCFPADTKILMEDGSVKNIQDIKIGDMVITHKGNIKKVLKTFVNPFNGNLKEIKISNNQSIQVTPEHPFYTLKNKRRVNHEYSFIEANSLKKKDYLLTPIISKYQEDEWLNPNRAKLLGLFAAEGSFAKIKNPKGPSGVIFTFGIHEENDLVKFTSDVLLSEFNITAKIKKYPKENKINVSVDNSKFARLIKSYISGTAKSKTLNSKIVYANKSNKLSFITGWLEGDGSVDKYSGKLVGTTVSVNLVNQISLMLNSLKINHGVFNDCSKDHYKMDGSLIKSGPNFRLKINSSDAEIFIDSSDKLNYKYKGISRPLNKWSNNYNTHRILQISDVAFVGNVYNFEVEEDNSYIANRIAVHNCNGDSFPETQLVQAHKNWIGKPLCVDHKSSSVDHVRGLIVDTYYDYKHKRIIALCALDKVAYPDLAHKVSSGVSNSVSMGVGVGRSVCFQCGNTATNANEFCDHVKYKTAYCEINYELQPIELSIVVNPADQKARIKEIFAAANHLENYFSKHSSKSPKLTHLVKTFGELSTKLENLSPEELEGIEKELHNLSLPTVIEKLNEAVNRAEDTADVVGDRISSSENSPEANPSDLQGLSAPQLRWAEDKFEQVFSSLNKISSLLENKEEQMSEKVEKSAWYQGGGGVNEPAPGQRKYPAEPLNEKDRNGEDKHMVGKSPFPNTGDPSKLFPGDEEKKKKMSRASESAERLMRRKEALNKAVESVKKEGFFQGGGGDNEPPAPGKRKYPADSLNEQDRNKGDKHMNPKPSDIKPEGLLGGKEEEKKKELMSRASTKLKFVKAAKPNGDEDLGNSAWQVFSDGKLVLTATVDEISGGRAEVMYDGIATKEFGRKMFAHLLENGIEKSASVYKKSQVAAPVDMAPPAPGASPAPAGVVTEPEAPAASPAPEMAGEGDPKEKVMSLAEGLRDMSSDLVDGVRALVGEQKEMGELDAFAPKSASTRALFRMRKQLNSELTQNFKSAVADLKERAAELDKFAQLMDQNVEGEQASALVEAVNEAVQDAEAAKENSLNLVQAFRKYVSSTEVLVKRAEAEARLEKSAQEADAWAVEDVELPTDKEDADMAKDETDVDMAAVDAMLSDLDQLDLDMDKEEAVDMACAEDHVHDENCATDGYDAAKPLTPAPEHKDMAQPMSATASDEEFDLGTKSGRMAYRAKLAAKGKEFMPLLHDAHPKGGVDLKDLSGDTYVEDLVEVSQKVREVATAPVKVRKQAAKLHELISEGKLDASNLDDLVAEGVDSETIKYYRDYYGELGPEGKEFAKELTKEHVKAEVDRQVEEQRVKLARAFEVANDMASVGLLPKEAAAINAQVNEIMSWNDAAFASMKRVIAQTAARSELTVKTATHLPPNGYLDEVTTAQPTTIKSELESVFAGRGSGRKGSW